MRNSTLIAFACVALVSIGVSSAAGSAATRTKVVSKLYGYSIVLDGGRGQWAVNYARIPWSAGPIDPDASSFDTYTQLATDRAYVLGSRPLQPKSSTLTTWTSFVISRRPPHCRAAAVSRIRTSTLAGAPARVFSFPCTDGYRVNAATALHSGHGYFAFVASPTSLSVASGRRAFLSVQRSFRFVSN